MKSETDEMLRVNEVAQMFAVSVREVWRLVAGGIIPQPIKLGPKTTRWLKSEICEFLEALKKRRKP